MNQSEIVKPAVRDSRFELLRILAMLMILLQHPLERCFTGGFSDLLEQPFSISFVGAMLLSIWGQLGVMLFVIISAWFMVDRKGIKSKKIIMLFLQVWTTCFIIMAVIGLLYPERINIRLIVKELLTPVYKYQYWFITTFLAYFLTIPIMQKLTQSLSDKALRNICLVMTMLIPLYNYLEENVGASWADFCYIFLVTAYLKRTPDNWFRKHCGLFWIGIAIITGCLLGYKLLFASKLGNGIFLKLFMSLRGRTLLLFIISIELFYCFERMKPIYSKIINSIGNTMFGVYLIHENYLFRGEENGNGLVWNDLLHIDKLYQNEPMFLLYYIGIVMGVFIACILLETLRQNLIERWYRSSRIINQLGEKFDKFYSKNMF